MHAGKKKSNWPSATSGTGTKHDELLVLPTGSRLILRNGALTIRTRQETLMEIINVFLLPPLLLPLSLFARPWRSVGNQELATTGPTGSLESYRHFKFKPDDPPSLTASRGNRPVRSILAVPSASLAGQQLIRRSKKLLAGVWSFTSPSLGNHKIVFAFTHCPIFKRAVLLLHVAPTRCPAWEAASDVAVKFVRVNWADGAENNPNVRAVTPLTHTHSTWAHTQWRYAQNPSGVECKNLHHLFLGAIGWRRGWGGWQPAEGTATK